MSKDKDFLKQHAWRRLAARYVDMSIGSILYVTILIMVIFIIEIDVDILTVFLGKHPLLDRYLSGLFISIFILPIIYACFGNTLGKKLLGIRIIDKNGNSINYFTALKRELSVFFNGLFFGVFSVYYQYICLKRNKISSWDKELNLTLIYTEQSSKIAAFKIIFYILLSIILVTGFDLLSEFL